VLGHGLMGLSEIIMPKVLKKEPVWLLSLIQTALKLTQLSLDASSFEQIPKEPFSTASEKATDRKSNWISQQPELTIVMKTTWHLGHLVSFKILQNYNRFKLCHPRLVLCSCPIGHILSLHRPVSG